MRSQRWFPSRRNVFQIDLDYPIDPQPRYGYGKPVHGALYERIQQNRNAYRNCLDQFAGFTDIRPGPGHYASMEFCQISMAPSGFTSLFLSWER